MQLLKLPEEVENAVDVEVARVTSLQEADPVLADVANLQKVLPNFNKLPKLLS